MALVKEYNSKGGISGFSLGYYEFFRRFYLGVNNINGRFHTGFIFNGMGFFRTTRICNCPHQLDHPCRYCQFPSCPHQKDELCFRCCESEYYGDIHWNDYHAIKDLFEFTLYQRAWIKDAKTQNQVQRDSKGMKNECRKRINFFISKLDEFFKERSRDRDIFLDRQTFKEIEKFGKTCLDKI